MFMFVSSKIRRRRQHETGKSGNSSKSGKSSNCQEHAPRDAVLRQPPALAVQEEDVMKKLLMISAAAAMLSTGALAQNTVVTTGAGHSAVRIEPEARTRIHSYVTEHKIRPVEMREKIAIGAPVPRDVELEAVPAEWGPSLTRYRYVYSGQRVILVDPETRAVIDEVE
jgi:Protein of unknown function (DUF1236)